ncbi:MAG: S9 family peptidase [Candidatus Limnocylindrales bacterium]
MTTSIEAILGARGAQRPQLSPDGTVLFFCSDRTGGRMQLWRVALGGGEPVRLTDVDRVGPYGLSPDGTQLVYAADLGGNERWQLHVMPADGGPSRDLTAAPSRMHHFNGWSRDGRSVYASANRRDERYFDLYAFGVDGPAEPRLLYRNDGTGTRGMALPDGSFIVRTDRGRSDQNDLWVLGPGGTTRRLTPEDPVAMHDTPVLAGDALLARSDRGRDFVGIATIDPDGGFAWTVTPDHDVDDLVGTTGHYAYAVNTDGASTIHVVDMRSKDSRRIDGLPEGAMAADGFGDSLAVGADGPVAAAWARFDAPTTVWIAAPGAPARCAVGAITDGVDDADLPSVETVSWRSFDGRPIPGFLLRQRGHEHERRPTVIQVHGGPEGQSRPVWNALTVALVADGFHVLLPNVRGSTGYGRVYQSLDDVRLRMDSVRDLDAAAEWVAESGVAPAERIGVMGGSYGGFMTLAAIGFFPERWAAAVSIVGIANWVTFFERTDPWRRPLREAEYGSLEHDRAFLESISPITKLDAIRAPLMVIHGANDPRVPVFEADQLVTALRDRGRAVDYLRYEDEGHGLQKAANRADAWPKVVAFLRSHLAVATDRR